MFSRNEGNRVLNRLGAPQLTAEEMEIVTPAARRAALRSAACPVEALTKTRSAHVFQFIASVVRTNT
jgi:hypothetical protein